MKKRIVILSLIVVILLGITTPVMAEGPPWPAFVIVHNNNFCSFWLKWDGTLEGIYGYDLNGNVTYEYQAKTGEWNANCSVWIDFNDPSVMPLKDVCAAFPDLCSKGTFIWKDIGCYGMEGQYTEDAQYIVTPSGHGKLTCHFHPNNP